MTSEGLGGMFEGDSADTCGGKFPLVPMGGRVQGLACLDPEARTPIGASRNLKDLNYPNEHTNFLKNKTKVKMGLRGGFLGMPSSPPITMCDIEMSFCPSPVFHSDVSVF